MSPQSVNCICRGWGRCRYERQGFVALAPWRHEVDKVDRVGKAEKAEGGPLGYFSHLPERCRYLQIAAHNSGTTCRLPSQNLEMGQPRQPLLGRHRVYQCDTLVPMPRSDTAIRASLWAESCPGIFHVCHPRLKKEGGRDDRKLHELGSNPEAIDSPVN